MNAVTLYRIDPAKNMHRFYRLDVQPDLFGAWCLVREWDAPAAPVKRAPLRSSLRRRPRRRSTSTSTSKTEGATLGFESTRYIVA